MKSFRLPTARLYVVLAATIALVALSPTYGALATLLALLVALVDALRCSRLDARDVTVNVPPRLGQGLEDALELRLQNRTGAPLHLRLAVDIPDALALPESHEPRTVDLPVRGRTRVRFPLAARRRGRHVLGDLHYRLRSPLGLSWRQSRLPVSHTLAVIPGLAEARSHRLHAWHHSLRHPGFRSSRQRLDSGAFESLRDYVRGDDPRRIDWKVTARRARTTVRRYEAERNQNIILCVDCGRLMAEMAGDRRRLDYALSAAVVLTDVARVWQDNVGVFVFSDHIQAMLPPARYPPDRIPSLFADVPSRAVEPNYPRALVTLSRLVSRRSLLVFFSDVIDDEVSAPLSRYLAQLATRHLPLFVALRNPDLHEAARAPVTSKDEALHRAAAVEMVLARSKTLQSMRHAGIQVVDAHPEGSIEAAVSRYIEIKRRGAL